MALALSDLPTAAVSLGYADQAVAIVSKPRALRRYLPVFREVALECRS